MKIIHTSDWHIGRQFHSVSLLDDQKYVLDQIVGQIKAHDIDALVIAGDIYDRSVPPAVAVELLDEVFNTIINELHVPILMISGNHDSASRLSFGSRHLSKAGLYILGKISDVDQPIYIEGSSGKKIAFYGIPYNDAEEVRNKFKIKVSSYDEAHQFLVKKIKAVMIEEDINILISHCFINGSAESDSERPLSLGGADGVSYKGLEEFNYVALGHLHGPQSRGQEHIRYSGSILKYSFSEQFHKKSIALVEFDSDGKAVIELLPLKAKRNMRIIEGELDQILEEGLHDPEFEDYLLIRLTDTHAILDAMGKLREVYPNVLHLEKTGIMSLGETQERGSEMLKRKPMDMFLDFYSQVSGNKMTHEQNIALEKIIKNLDNEELRS